VIFHRASASGSIPEGHPPSRSHPAVRSPSPPPTCSCCHARPSTSRTERPLSSAAHPPEAKSCPTSWLDMTLLRTAARSTCTEQRDLPMSVRVTPPTVTHRGRTQLSDHAPERLRSQARLSVWSKRRGALPHVRPQAEDGAPAPPAGPAARRRRLEPVQKLLTAPCRSPV